MKQSDFEQFLKKTPHVIAFQFHRKHVTLKLKKNFNSIFNFHECADISFQVARGRLKGNFIVHNSASTSHFRRRRQIVLAVQGRDQQ